MAGFTPPTVVATVTASLMDLLPALTTTFTPPKTCLSPTLTLTPGGKDSLSVVENITIFERGIVSECYPPVSGEPISFIYSPGLICPLGYYTAKQDENRKGADTFYDATCCPLNMTLFNDDPGNSNCMPTSSNYRVVFTNGSQTVTKTFSSHDYYFFATAIALSWQNADLSSLTNPPTSTRSLKSFNSTANIVPITSLIASSAPTSAVINNTLSGRAKAGIGTGIAIPVIAIILLLWLILHKRSQQGKNTIDKDFSKPELHNESLIRPVPQMTELDDTHAINEISGNEAPQELDNQKALGELEGGWQGHEAPTN